ncbi:MAG TPA: hypothetical protein PKU78_03365 [Candidatus Dojkabacteria bacterium]|mgnify:CR=1 FL=1|nr:hypothetical protein [Candidatus Dojkabacteria bacterium]HRO65234.1 hypothetical protein [Candidatus Dojkabacteria bacterium]HRP50799.1 hypothetical protein [Candidatus Dojkabacteria bacterium]
MTDKEKAEKKNEYYEKFVGYDAYDELTDAEQEKLLIWEWIEELIKEVENKIESDIQDIRIDYYQKYLGHNVLKELSVHEMEKVMIWNWFEEKLRNFS